jgi:hypothetical protein
MSPPHLGQVIEAAWFMGSEIYGALQDFVQVV